MKRFRILTTVFMISAFVWIISEQYIKNDIQPRMIPTHAEENSLLKQIQLFSNENNVQAIDAIVDRVWKAVPGYNGIEVDIEASYKKMKEENTFSKEKIVYQEIRPKVQLQDLPPSPIYKGNSEKPMISLLINVAWGNEFIPDILASLAERNVKATFFFDGSWVKKNPDLAKIIYLENHEIGNHAYSHPNLKNYSTSQTKEELMKTNQVIEETLHVKPKWFAPPSGSFKQETIEIARNLDMFTILWTVDTIDWRKPATDVMVTRVLSQVASGSMILMHPTKPTAEGLGRMIDEITAKGYKIGTVSEIMSSDRIND